MSASKVYNSWDVLKHVQGNLLPTIKMISFYKGTTGDCALFVTHDGAMYAVGKSTVGCLGLGNVVESTEPRCLNEITGVSGVSMCGDYGDVLAITTEGKLYTWGANSNATNTPTLKSELSDIVDAKCKAGNYLALTKDGKVYQWKGVTFHGLTEITTTPTLIQINEVVSIACGAYSSLITTKNGKVYAWGKEYNINYTPQVYPRSCPVNINVLGESIAKMACCGYYNLVLTHSGKIYSWGKNTHGLGNGSTVSTSAVKVGAHIAKFVDVAASNYRCAAITEGKDVYIWGEGVSATISLAPEYNGIHQFFAKSSCTSFLWICKTRSSIDFEGFGLMAEKLKNSFNCEDWSDLTLIIDGKPIYVQSFILKLRSNYFQTMLQEHWTGKNTREIKLYSFSYEVYRSFFWYLYSGEVDIPMENIFELWSLAHQYNEDNLKKACKILVERDLSFEDFAEQAVLMKTNNKSSTDEDDVNGSASSFQPEHMTSEIEKNNAKLLDKMQKDFTIKLERQQGELAALHQELESLQNNYTSQQKELESVKNNYTSQQEELESLQNNYTSQQEDLEYLRDQI